MSKETKSKKRRLLTLFDIIIIILVIVIALVAYKMTSSGSSTDSQSSTVTYTIELAEMEHGSAELIAPGQSLKDNIKKFAIGQVVSVEVSDTVIYVRDGADFTYASQSPEGMQTALITVTAPCTVSDSAITVDSGFAVRCGESVAVSGPGYAGAGYIVAVERGQ